MPAPAKPHGLGSAVLRGTLVPWLVGLGLTLLVAQQAGCSRFEPLAAADAGSTNDVAVDTADGVGTPTDAISAVDAADAIGSDAQADVAPADDVTTADTVDAGTVDAASATDATGGDAPVPDANPDGAVEDVPQIADPAPETLADLPDEPEAETSVVDDAEVGEPDVGPIVEEVGPADVPPEIVDIPEPPAEVDAGPECLVPGIDCPCTVDEECDAVVDAAQCERGSCQDGTCSVVADLEANGQPCSDGSGCTGSDQCGDGVCAGQPLLCNDGNDCTDDFCDEGAAACVNTPLTGAECDDGDVCTSADLCLFTGSCEGTPVTCPDGPNPCIVPTCSKVTGVCNLNTFPDSGTQCGDPDACGAAPVCDGSGSCDPAPPVPCLDDGVECTSDVCDTVSGECMHLPIGDGEPCGPPGDACFVGPVCEAGVCLPGHALAFNTTLAHDNTALGVDLVAAPGGFVALSITETDAGDSDALLQHIAPTGQIYSGSTFGSAFSDIPRALVARPDGTYAFVGLTLSTTPYQGWIVFADDSLVLTEQHVAGAETDLGIETVQTMGDDLLVAGTVAPATAWWARANEQAGVVEEHTFEDLPLTLVTTSATDVDGGYVLAGFALSGAGSELLLLKLDPDGLLVTSQLPGAGLSVQPTSITVADDGTRIVAGFELSPTGGTDAYIWRIDPGGGLIDATPVGTAGERSLYRVAVNPLGRILAGGRAAPANGAGPAWFVALEDNEGLLVQTVDKVYAAENTTNRVLGVIADADGGSFLLGTGLSDAGLELPWFALVTEVGEAICVQ